MPHFLNNKNLKTWRPAHEGDRRQDVTPVPRAEVGTKSLDDRITNTANAISEAAIARQMKPADLAQYILDSSRNLELDAQAIFSKLDIKTLPAHYRARVAARFKALMKEEEENKLR